MTNETRKENLKQLWDDYLNLSSSYVDKLEMDEFAAGLLSYISKMLYDTRADEEDIRTLLRESFYIGRECSQKGGAQ